MRVEPATSHGPVVPVVLVQPGRPALDFRFPPVPGPRLGDGSSAGAPPSLASG